METTCIVCNKSYPDDYNTNWFYNHGGYGSTVYDPMDGSYLLIVVCDECLKARIGSDIVLQGRDTKPVRYNGLTVGKCKTPGRKLIPWNGDGSFDATDVLNVSEDDLRNAENLPEITWFAPPADILKMDKPDNV